MKLQDKERFLFIGDSITDMGRSKPIAHGNIDAMGNSYVLFFFALLYAKHPEYSIDIINMGISGNRVRDLKTRWEEDVMSFNPDWLSILIGANDVWRQFDNPTNAECHVLEKEYYNTLDELIAASKQTIKNIILLRPFFVEENKNDPMCAKMNVYGDMVKELSKKHDVHYIDLQSTFDEVLKHKGHMVLSVDRVHPNPCAHMIIAQKILDYLEK